MGDVVVKSWSQLTTAELYAIAKLRCDVFMWEQRADDEEMDWRDLEPRTVHVWLGAGRDCVAYLRLLWDEEAEHAAHRVIGRVAVRADHRGQGLAQRLMARAVEIIDAEGVASILHSQSYVVGLYARFGYAAFGDEYVEAGIAHRSMLRPALGA
jgi:ElaA protein